MTELEIFFKLLFGPTTTGYLCISLLNPENKKDMQTRWFTYPQELEQVLATVESYKDTHNVYFCPQIFSKRERHKDNVLYAPNIWADLDTCIPDKLLVKPSIVVESSPGRYQAYWVLDDYETAPEDAEALSRRIAYYHANDGCDKTGWDLTQLLRVPGTHNLKYMDHKVVPLVKILKFNKAYYRLSDFGEYPNLVDYTYTDIPLPEEFPKDAEDILASHKNTLNPLIWRLFTETPDLHTWSNTLWNLEMLLFEAGFSREDVFVIVKSAKCNKYARDGRPDSHLWKEVCRAETTFKVGKEILVKKPEIIKTLLTEQERKHVNSLEPTFVERYIDWASSLGDAAKQYHQAGAFVILSSILSGTVKLPTRYGTIIPNVWFMILGDTTLTRKTTSMDIAMSLIENLDKDLIMATDGSVEGLFTNLSLRPGKPSIFLRDEFSGLISAMNRKDYMSDLPEMLTKLYDGKMQKRILRKEIIEISDPRLIIYAGGIKNKILASLTSEHIGSGFIPRFIFITAESDMSKMQPLGPPTMENKDERENIFKEIKKIHRHYSGKHTIKIDGIDAELNATKEFDVSMTDDAWVRYNELELTLVELGIRSNSPDESTPMGDRLSKSILKCAMLIAASRQFNDGTSVVLTLDDLLRAINFGEMWREYADEVVEGIASSPHEKLISNIYKYLKRKGDTGASRSSIMRANKLSSKDAKSIFDTMEDRGMIDIVRESQTITYFARDYV